MRKIAQGLAPRTFRLGIAGVALAAAGPVATPTATAAPLVGSGKWVAPFGATSYCDQITTTVIRCHHYATAGSTDPLTSTCRAEHVVVGSIAVIGACQVVLTGTTSGSGRVVNDGFAPGCYTIGLDSGTLMYTDPDGVTYTVTISIANFGGVAFYNGTILNASGVRVGHAQGTFTMACGGANGTFKGTFTLA